MVMLPGSKDVSQVQVGRDPGVRVPSPVSSGLHELGSAISHIGQQFQEANDARVLSKLETDTAVAFNDFKMELEKDPDSFETWDSKFQEFAKAHKDAVQKSGVSKDVFGAWERSYAPMAERTRMGILHNARTTMVDKGVTELQSNLRTWRDLAITASKTDRTEVYIPKAMVEIERKQNKGFIPDSVADKLRENHIKEIERGRFQNDLAKSPEYALGNLNAGEYQVSETDKSAWKKEAMAAAKPVILKRKSQEQADSIMSTEPDPVKQIEIARAIKEPDVRDATVARVKTRQEEAKNLADLQRKKASDDLTSQAMDIYTNNGSKEDFLDLVAGAPDGKTKKELVTLSNTLYGKPGEVKQTDYDRVSKAHDEIDAAVVNGQKLTEQYLLRTYKPYLKDGDYEQLVKYNQDAFDKRVSKSIESAKTKIREMYNRQDFGPITGGDSAEAKRIKGDLLFGLNQWVKDNPNQDPQQYVDSKLDLIAAEETAKGLNTFWEMFVPGQQKDERLKAIAAGEIDDDVLAEMLRERGKDPASYSAATLKALKNTAEFNRYKTELLSK